MNRQAIVAISMLALLVGGCVSTPNPYPPFDGRWLYDYAASMGQDTSLPADFEESISRLDREGRTDAHKRLEAIAMKLRPPEILRIEYVGTTMAIRGGGAFERNYELSNLNPAPGVEVKWDMVKLEARLTDEMIEMTERYELSADHRRLFISITMSSPALDEPLELQWVYMAAAAF